MKKILALCLTFVMVLSMLTVAVSAATINVPAETLVNQSFANISGAPAGWTVTSQNGDVTYEATHIQFASSNGDVEKYLKVAYDKPFNAAGKEYTLTFKLGHYDGVTYVHFGADSKAEAVAGFTTSNGTAVKGYTLVAGIGRNSDWSKGYYDLYKDGVLLGSIQDPSTSYSYKSLRNFKFVVNANGITASINDAGEVTFANAAGEESDYAGYVGFHIGNNSGGTTNTAKLGEVKLVRAAYSYDMNDTTATGGYLVTGTEYVEDYTGELYFNSDLRNLGDETPADRGVTGAPAGYTASATGIAYTGYPNQNLAFGTVANGASNMTIEARYASAPASNEAQLVFGNYVLYGGASQTAKGNYILKKSGAELGSVSCGSTGNGTLHTVKLVFEGTTVKVIVDGVEKISVTDETPELSGKVSLKANYAGSPAYAYVKAYSNDFADRSYYRDIKRDGFVLDEAFTNANGDDLDAIKAKGFKITGFDTVTEKGIERTTAGEGTITYDTYKFGGSYTAQVDFRVSDNKSTLYLNYTDNDNCYVLSTTTGKNLTLVKKVKGDNAAEATVTTLIDVTHSDTMLSYDASYIVNFKMNADGSMDITVNASANGAGYATYTCTDDTPITEGYLKYAQGWVTGTNIRRVSLIKVYSGTSVPTWNGEFFVNGSNVAGKGDTLFALESAMLSEDATIIAALYEDKTMTDIKMVDLDTLNKTGYASLFNTSSSNADTVNVKVFVWDSVSGMTPVTSAFSMNK